MHLMSSKAEYSERQYHSITLLMKSRKNSIQKVEKRSMIAMRPNTAEFPNFSATHPASKGNRIRAKDPEAAK